MYSPLEKSKYELAYSEIDELKSLGLVSARASLIRAGELRFSVIYDEIEITFKPNDYAKSHFNVDVGLMSASFTDFGAPALDRAKECLRLYADKQVQWISCQS